MPSYKALIENSDDVISLVSAGGEVLYTSASSAKVFGYPPNELVGRNTFDLFHPEDRDHSRRAVREVLANPPGPRRMEARIRHKSGQWCWVESTIANRLAEPGVAAIVLNCREISARKAVREQERQHIQELVRSNAELEDFAHAVAHDLREPLRTISMFTQLLVKEAPLEDHDKLLGDFIIDAVARMSALFEGLHAFALRGVDGHPQPVDLGLVVANVLQNLRHAIVTNNAAVLVDSLPHVLGNEKHLLRVFQNLIANAIKYRSEAPLEIHVSVEQLESDWVIRVKDNGIGISHEHHERVFQLLTRLHGPGSPGSGIGLAICKKIIESSGGRIWVESESGAGSTFCFTIAARTSTGYFTTRLDKTRVGWN
jgi:PAS domain S-box-containing protein